MPMKNKHPCKITFYGRKINRIVINPHVQKHRKHGITDQLILAMIKNLDKKKFKPEEKKGL
jgi:hypothetical protein